MTFAVLDRIPASDCQLLARQSGPPRCVVKALDNVGGIAIGHHPLGRRNQSQAICRSAVTGSIIGLTSCPEDDPGDNHREAGHFVRGG